MKRLIEEFPNQLRHAMDIGQKAVLRTNGKRPGNVLIMGMGGSGIGGSLVRDLCKATASVPVFVSKGYKVPRWVGPETLVIACSYSGNTEEVLEASAQALENGATVAGITSGGRLKNLCEERGLNHILIPGGNPPRSMLGYSMVQILHVLSHYDVKTPAFQEQFKAVAKLLDSDSDSIQKQAMELAKSLKNKTVAVYAPEGYGAVATRWRQQLNENAKMTGWDSEVPEMNHNELVGWAGGHYNLSAIFLRSPEDEGRNARRMDLNMATISQHTTDIHVVSARGESQLERSLYLIHIGDWLSYFLSEIHGCDIMDIKVIEKLKEALNQAE